MVAAAWGACDLLDLAIGLGANLHLTAPNGWTALEFAKNTNQIKSIQLLEQHLAEQDDFYDPQDVVQA